MELINKATYSKHSSYLKRYFRIMDLDTKQAILIMAALIAEMETEK